MYLLSMYYLPRGMDESMYTETIYRVTYAKCESTHGSGNKHLTCLQMPNIPIIRPLAENLPFHSDSSMNGFRCSLIEEKPQS